MEAGLAAWFVVVVVESKQAEVELGSKWLFGRMAEVEALNSDIVIKLGHFDFHLCKMAEGLKLRRSQFGEIDELEEESRFG